MEFEENGIRFSPVVPKSFQGLTLSGVKYRNATLKIVVRGHGTQGSLFKLDGKERKDPFFDAALKGDHEIEIRMSR
jgi:cellobiose phosphorylase